ncbi:MAG: helix-turn-helix domain-containing protein [Gemmataceae bacterium]|nr:helix-turn-helix domain-containing protein [Gemmataceae bacterium]
MPPRKSVVLLIDSATSWGTSIIQGIARYAEENGPWLLYLGQYGKQERQSLPPHDKVDGCIARVTSQTLADELIAADLPAVNVSWSRFGEGRIPTCTADGRKAGALAADDFLARGYTHFGYYGPPPAPTARDACREAFSGVLAGFGFGCSCVDAAKPPRDEPAHKLLERLRAWAGALEKPAAVLTYDSFYGRELTDALAQCGWRVPEDVSVLSAEHDDLFTRLSHPRLSAIDLAPRTIGYQAGALLDRLMRGVPAPTEPVLIAPEGILAAESTDVLAVADPLVRAALHYIRGHAGGPMQVGDVAEAVGASRRRLEQHFRRAVRCSPAALIRRVRLDRARNLLCEGDLSVSAIAARSGFEHPEVFARAFRRQFGASPSDYRNRPRG